MSLRNVLREGLVTGMIGAAIIALWFLIADAIAGKPLFTPAMLGSALFWGLRDPAAVEISFAAVAGYTMIHVVALTIVGTVAAAVAFQVERVPSTLFLAIVLFAVHEFGFYVVVAILAQPLLGALAWWSVAISNAVAAAGMGYYLWRQHPRLREQLAKHPLGAPIDESSDTIRPV
jgi:hypothetical protein